jgi:hypothetical protein
MKMELRRRALDKVYKRRDKIDMPDFQREEVWTEDQKRRLIDTILQGWHLPKFYFRKVDDGAFECVDGQQRLAAIFEFYDGKLKLSPAIAAKYGGSSYSKLKADYSDAFDDFEIDIEEIEDAADDELEDLFVRLQLGTPLTTAEKLNALSGGARDFAHWIADQAFFRRRIGVRDTRYAHFDIATKWLFIEARGIQAQMRFLQLEAFLRDNRSFDSASGVAKRVKAALKYLKQAFPKEVPELRNRASVLSVCMLAARVVEAKVPITTARRFGAFIRKFFADLTAEVEKGAKATNTDLLEYQEAISYGSTGGDSIQNRLGILCRRLVTFDPAFNAVVGGGKGSGRSTAALEGVVEEISSLIYAVNERSTSNAGEDVFKMTNRSARAVKKLASRCACEKDFGELVDSLYFVVYEGSGDCKRLPSPPPDFAMDVKFLRTHLRHDLDHGDEREAVRKRRRGAALLRKYLGKPSVAECGPGEFTAGQLRLLEELKRMLTDLPSR